MRLPFVYGFKVEEVADAALGRCMGARHGLENSDNTRWLEYNEPRVCLDY